MTPYPGESLSVDSFTNISGAPVGSIEAIQLRAGSSTFTAGDSVELSSDLMWQYMEGGETVVVSWVVEVLSGTGTLTLSEGMSNTATSLGAHAVTGPTTLVVASSVIDGPTVYADVDARLLLTCTSGTVEVQQVKLRVWPPEGVAGGWSDLYPSWQTDGPASGTYVTRDVTENTSTNSGAAAEWADAIAAGQAHADEPYTTPGGSNFKSAPLAFGSIARITAEESLIDGTSGGTFLARDLAAVVIDKTPAEFAPIDPSLGLVEGVDYITPPDEVSYDFAATYQAEGSESTEWINLGVGVQGDTGPEGAATITVQPYAGDIEALPSWPDTGATVLATGDNALAVPGGDTLLVVGSHLWMTNAPDFPGGLVAETVGDWQWSLGVGNPDNPDTFQPLGVLSTYPPYRLWNPNAVPAQQPLRLMQRSDGLGMGSGRVLGVGTRQASTRVFGSL